VFYVIKHDTQPGNELMSYTPWYSTNRKADSYTDGQEIPYMYDTLEFVIVFIQSRQWTLPRAS